MTAEDMLRRDVIFYIVCQHYLDFAEIEEKYNIRFKAKFAEDLRGLADLERDGLVEIGDDFIRVTPIGRIFAHHVAKPFDLYLRNELGYVRTHAAIMAETGSRDLQEN